MENGVLGGTANRAVDRALAERRAGYADEVRRLIKAAFVVIERTGTLEPRVSEILDEAGLCNAAFYRHFRSKQALLVAVLDEGIRLLAGYVQHRMEQADSPRDQVREWIWGILEQALNPDGASATRPFALAGGQLAVRYPAEIAEAKRQLTTLLADALRRGVEGGEFPHADPECDAEALHLLAMGWVEVRLADGAVADRVGAERLVEFALAGLARTPDVQGKED